MDSRQKRVHQDNSTSDNQIGKIYYSICPDNSDWYRTIRIANNPFTGHRQSYVSNPVNGVPPDGMEKIPELMRTRLMSMNNALPHTY